MRDNIKIGMVCGRSPLEYYGGIEHHVLEISKRLMMIGYHITIYSTVVGHASIKSINGIQVECFPAYAPGELYYFSSSLYKAIKTAKCEILHGHGYQDFAFLCTALAKKPNQKLVLTLHSAGLSSLANLLHIPYKLVLNKALKKAEKIICVSNPEYNRFAKYFVIPHDRFSIIPNAVNPEEFKNGNISAISDESIPFILTVTRLEKYKGCQHILKGFARLEVSNDLKLIILGSGPYKNKLVKLARKLGIRKNIEFLEGVPRSQQVALYRNCKLCILLSKYESGGLAVMEAMAAGKPVIVADTSALSEFVQKGWAVGVPYPPHPDIVAQKIRMILEQPSRFIPKNFKTRSWDDVANELDILYQSILGRA